MEKLTKKQKAEKIAAIKEGRDATVKTHRDAMTRRMENYYNCLDDYSFGGICDQASQSAISQAERRAAMLIEQVNNDGYLLETCEALCLYDLEGNFITDHIVRTKYGQAFLFDGNFVSVAKKQATYAKKGYACKTRVRDFKVVFTGKFSQKGNPIYSEIELIEERVEDNMEGTWGLSFIDYCYTMNELRKQESAARLAEEAKDEELQNRLSSKAKADADEIAKKFDNL